MPQVVDELVQKFNSVAEVIPIIKTYVEEVSVSLILTSSYNFVCRERKIHRSPLIWKMLV